MQVVFPDYDGVKCIEIFDTEHRLFEPIYDENGVLQVDSRGFPLYYKCTRLYLDDVPGGPSWPQERIDIAVQMINDALPGDWRLGQFQEDPGRAHISFSFYRLGHEQSYG